MKTFKLLKNIGLILFLGLVTTACSSSDDNKGGKGSNLLENVPKGEIVPEAQRFITLTGYDENVAVKSNSATVLNADSQKWWRMEKSGVIYWYEGKYETDVEDGDFTYYAFYPNGKLYARYTLEDTPIEYASWRWIDSSKSKIGVKTSFTEELVYEITELNSFGVTYAHIISEMGYTTVLWEQYKLGN
ncbi:hypothetical protein [Myroides indicus]|uniref:Lipocalin-like protein n=1 Tax=Myroides indicus TaxID=1323422 RepID=A0A4R7FCV2_9FLAO|nr:hypothetical protein [Myroides indicus]TDS65083.1 hypothetical protein C8P70_103105 [Myroides indicus]